MAQARVRHVVKDYDAWKALFDSDPLDRRGSGVLRFQISRGVDEPNAVCVDLDFDTVEQAQSLASRLRELWKGPAGAAFDSSEVTVVAVAEVGEG